MVNHYYFYCVDREFGPFFLKFCSYFPYTGKLCLNGHEWLKRQLSQRSIDYVPLDNGILSCNDPRRLQQLADSGLRSALFVTRLYCRILRPGMSQLAPVAPALPPPIGARSRKLEPALDQWRHRAKLAA